jgi:hypothetical protein
MEEREFYEIINQMFREYLRTHPVPDTGIVINIRIAISASGWSSGWSSATKGDDLESGPSSDGLGKNLGAATLCSPGERLQRIAGAPGVPRLDGNGHERLAAGQG